MKKEPIKITLETVSHEEFLKVAHELKKQLDTGNRVELALAPHLHEAGVRSLLVGRYLTHTMAAKLIITQSQ